MPQRLGVNVDHVATLRQARRTTYPDPVTAAAMAELAGAAQITIHLREDRRHIQERDLRVLRQTVQTLLNLEMAATPEMVKMAYEHKPDMVTLVPERREEVTTEGGLDVNAQKDTIAKIVKNLKDGDIITSLFIDPDVDQVKASHKVSADRIELHTGRYCEARTEKDRQREFVRIVDSAKTAGKLGLGCAAGHGLHYENVRAIARLPEIDELNIGHSIVARAVMVGFDRAVREMVEIPEEPVKRALTAAEMRAVDAAAADHGMPGSVLMENAGEALTRTALSEAGEGGRFFVLCGLGNNGGDGLVVARKLAGLGRTVFVELAGERSALKGDALRNFDALKSCGLTPGAIAIELAAGPGDVIVDALLGTGLSRAPEGPVAEAIGRISVWRAAGAKVVSADLPSGLESDSGLPLSPCVTADVTTTFGYVKVGQAIEPGVSRCGRLEIIDIGIPRAAERVLEGPGVFLLEEGDVRGRVPKRRSDSHKGSYGHVLVVGGSWGKTGAAALAAMGALRGGAGLVTVATRPEALVPVMQHAPEVMGLELVNEGALGPRDLNALLDAAEGKQAVVFGPGIERDDDTWKLLGPFLEELTCPCVLDADGLNALAGHLELLQRAKSELLLTPHPGEMARLLGLTTAEVQKNRIPLARAFAKDHQVVLVLKGARTLIARDDGTVFINATGNPGLATGGTGDVLSGLCGALLGQGLSTEDAAIAGAWVHGLAGDLARERRGEMGLIASDLLDGLGEVWRRWGR